MGEYRMQTAWFGRDSYKKRTLQSEPVYAAMVRSPDINVGWLLQKIMVLSPDENTLIVLISDNGGLSTAQGSVTSNEAIPAVFKVKEMGEARYACITG